MNVQHTKTYDKLTSIKINIPKHTIGEDERRSKDSNEDYSKLNVSNIKQINNSIIIIGDKEREKEK